MTVTKLLVCTDCALIIAYDDWSVLNGSYAPDQADQREAAIKAGLTKHGELIVDMGSDPVSCDTLPACDCCGYRSSPLWSANKQREITK